MPILDKDTGKEIPTDQIAQHPDVKPIVTKAVTAAVDEATAELKQSVSRLEANNAELTAEKKKASERATKAENDLKFSTEKKETQIEEVRAAVQAELQPRIDDLTNENGNLKGQLDKVLIDNGLTQALAQAKVLPHFMDAAALLIRNKHKAEVKNGAAVIDGKPLADFVAGWAGTDTGKHYVAADDNGGGGAGGGNGGGKDGETNPWAKATFNLTKQGQITRDNPELASRLKKEAGAK